MILEAKGHFQEFVATIRTHGMESSDLTIIAKLKSVLWAVVSLQKDNCIVALADTYSAGPYWLNGGRSGLP